MDTKQFIASLVSSLAWPATVSFALWLFRKQLAQLLTGPIRRWKAGPVEVEYDRIVSRVEARIEPAEAAGPAAVEVPPAAESVVAELEQYAHTWPSGSVIEAFSRVEYELRERLRAAGTDESDLRKYGGVMLARRAAADGIITRTTAEAVEGIAVLRNLAAHGGPGEVTQERALEYLALVDGVLFAISRDAKGGQQSGN